MPRPKKNPKDKKDVDLRIPVTRDQQAFIQDALGGEEFAGWARGILLQEAEKLRESRSKLPQKAYKKRNAT